VGKMRLTSEQDFLITECDCYESDGYQLFLPNNTKLRLCQKCHKALGEQYKKIIDIENKGD
jgi:hypothetical protein